MSEIRELAMRLAMENGFAIDEFGGFVGGEEHMEAIVRAAMREGMMRAAKLCDEVEDSASNDSRVVAGAFRCSLSIRVEADKLEGKL